MINNISGVILAGGSNKRFNGLIKSKIVIEGKTIISRVLGVLGDIFDEIIIVTNTPEEFKEYNNYKIIGDRFHNKGPLAGIHSALKSTDSEAIFVVAGDMPFLDKEIIVRQINFFEHNDCEILIPKINQYIEPLHGIYRKKIFRSLEEHLEGDNDYAIREFIKKADVRYLLLEGSEKLTQVFTNINSLSDISVLKSYLGLAE